MIRDIDLEPLQRWLNCDMSPATIGGLVTRPGFTQAARALNKVKVEAAADPVMAVLSRDAGHYVAASLAFSLHRESGHPESGPEGSGQQGSGITLPRLQAACVQTKFMSAGRARAMLAYLQYVGFLSQVSPRRRQSAAVYAPTPRFIEAWCGRMRRGLDAIAPLEPFLRPLIDRMDDPTVAVAFAQRRGDSIMAGLARGTGHELPFVRIFNHRLGGGRALALLLSRDTGAEPLATASVPWALADVMQHCGISRVQAKRLFADAVAEGLVAIEGGRLTWLEESRRLIAFGAAFEIASMLTSAAATVTAFPEVFLSTGRDWAPYAGRVDARTPHFPPVEPNL